MTYIFCSHCKIDLTHTGGPRDHSLRLSDRQYGPPDGWPTIDVLIHPIIEEDYHFCGLGCLTAWACHKNVKYHQEKGFNYVPS